MSTEAPHSLRVNDRVWVKPGIGDHEELGVVTSVEEEPGGGGAGDPGGNASEEGEGGGDCRVAVKYTISGYEAVITRSDRIRPMESPSAAAEEVEGRRRSRRSAGRGDGGNVDGSGRDDADVASAVTPSPAPTDGSGPGSAAVGSSDAARPSGKKNGRVGKKRKRDESSGPPGGNANKAKAAAKKRAGGNGGNNGKKAKGTAAADEGGGKSSPYFAKSGASSGKARKGTKGGGRKLILASSEDDDDVDEEEGMESKATATAKKKKKKPAAKRTKASGKGSGRGATDPPPGPEDVCQPVSSPAGNRPDGHGGLNQPVQPWVVEYSKTGRATCRTCDGKIAKGGLRVGNTPLFRGKPGYMVYRHIQCTTFAESILSATDVEGHEDLTVEDYDLLKEQVEVSKERIKEEREELHPDELVQKTFEGEIRGTPEGLSDEVSLLPFQVEGFSWMRHQEVVAADVRGGILADEMGMGKTLQAISTVLDNRPLLQHAAPGMKHPPTSDLPRRQSEEGLWEKAKSDWLHEMEMLKVPGKLRRRDGGARAGTLVICPVIALCQWKTEIEKFTKEGALSVGVYHGVDREKTMPRELMKKYDVVLTTYQVLEADFRKMTSPNRVACPNCGGKFKIDKLPIHLKYFCGDGAERTEAQARQVRNSEREGGGGGGGRRGRGPVSGMGGKSNKADKETKTYKDKPAKEMKKKPKKRTKKAPAPKKPPAKEVVNKAPVKSIETPARTTSRRSAARKAASQISQSAAEWSPDGEDSDEGDNFRLDSVDDSSGDDDDSSEGFSRDDDDGGGDDDDSSSDSDDSELERAREKQRQALEMSRAKGKKTMPKKNMPASTARGKKVSKGTGAKGRKGAKKKFDDEDYSSSEESADEDEDGENQIDMAKLVEEAMAGAKNSVLHSLCWWRIILDEAHFIKTRSSQTANASFSLVGIHRWALSGTPLQNRVGEFYSLVRFLRMDPMAFYHCRGKGCDCKSMHYRIVAGICEGCGHSGIQHYSHFNKYILNPIQRDGYSGDGRRAMFLLKNEVLDKALLRRTKETEAADMELPPRLVQIKPIKLHPVEEDFYSALYTQTKSSFSDYVESGTLLNNYAHIFDLLIRMRQSVDHPYLIVYSKKNSDLASAGGVVANGSVDCDLCHEPPTDRVVSTCCSAAFCRSCVLEYMATSNSMASASAASLRCPSCRENFSIDLQAHADIEDDSSLNVSSASGRTCSSDFGVPSLKELKHVATGSILRRINLAEFATSSKIEALTQELVKMRQSSPGSKAIVFSQFVNMLDLIRWRLHSDPYLEEVGLGCRALHGGMNVKARDACLKEFREDNNVRVLLMSLKAGGVALNLTCANHVYLMDPWWNPAAEMQAIDRTHRLGQYRPIRAVRFIAEDTVEERILQLQEKKRLVFDGTVGRDAGSLKMLTVDDMKSLFA